jgi:hypothetical protein
MKPTHTLTRRLRPLTVLDTNSLAHVAGGHQTASTSTSGTPEAGDDTIGDSSGRHSFVEFTVTKHT